MTNQILFDIRLLCDIESIHFEIAKNYINSLTDQAVSTDHICCLRNSGLKIGTRNLMAAYQITDGALIDAAVTNIFNEFNKYSVLMKPRLLEHYMANQIVKSGIKVTAYSCYEDEINEFLKKNISKFYQDIEILKSTELDAYIEKYDAKCTMITSEDPSKLVSNTILKSIVHF